VEEEKEEAEEEEEEKHLDRHKLYKVVNGETKS